MALSLRVVLVLVIPVAVLAAKACRCLRIATSMPPRSTAMVARPRSGPGENEKRSSRR